MVVGLKQSIPILVQAILEITTTISLLPPG